jgi:hypothetical protein
MLSEKDILAWQGHYRDLLYEAEQERIIRQALGRKKPIRFHERALRGLELYFVAWSRYLQRCDAFGVFDGKAVAFRGVGAIASGRGYV